MSRENGFTVADVDTSLHSDAKIKRLWRIVHDEPLMNAAVALYEAVRLESWAEGERVSADDAAPVWMSDTSPALTALREAELLDDEYRIPQKAWDSWFGPARERRDQRREAGRIGGRNSRGGGSGKQPSSEPEAPLEQPSTTAEPDRTVPSVPSRTVPSALAETRASGLEKVSVIAQDIDFGNDPVPVDHRRLQKLAAELTGNAFVSIHSGLGLKAADEQLPHGFAAVENAWRQVDAHVRASSGPGVKPTLRQLVFGADEILNAVPRPDPKDSRAEEQRIAYEKRVERTRQQTAEYRRQMESQTKPAA